jgi:O-succinylbenzoic acid--CoA ligase
MIKCNTLTINNQTYSNRELKLLSEERTGNKNTPAWEKAIYKFILNWLNYSDTIVQYSSGTTGRSKMINLLKSSMIRSAENTCRYFNLRKGQTAALCLPVNYIAGKMMVVRSIVGGLNLCLIEPAGTPDFSQIDAIDFCAMVPLQVINVFHNLDKHPPIKKLIIGGGEILADLEKLLESSPVEAYATYGMAETCSHIAVRRLNSQNFQTDYHVFPGITIGIDNRDCLFIKADYLPEIIITNDLVKLTSPSSFKWQGRYDNLISSGGIKIAPEEVEAIIRNKIGLDCAIIGVPDKKLGQRLLMVTEKIDVQNRIQSIRSKLEKLLPSKLLPKEILSIEKFPRNKAFKLDRKKLTDMFYTRS